MGSRGMVRINARTSLGTVRAARLTVADLPGPEEARAFQVPADDGRGFDDIDAGLPVVPDRAQPGPQPSIRRGQFGSLEGGLPNAEWMAEREDLELQGCAAPELSPLHGDVSGCQRGNGHAGNQRHDLRLLRVHSAVFTGISAGG